MKFISPSLSYVQRIHKKMLQKYSSLDGIRDINALESALASAHIGFSDGTEAYPDLIDKICIVSFKLVTNHPFVDGNKRVGAYMLISLLKRYGFIILFTKEELERIILGTASGSIDFEEFNQWVRNHSEHTFKE